MPQGYDYGNARLRARRSRLLTAADYSTLLAKASIEDVITALTETPYKDDVQAALLQATGVQCVFTAVRTNLTRTLHEVRGFFEGEPRRLVDLLLRRWDRHNLLTILRGQSREAPAEEVLSAIVPVGQLDTVALRELARQPGLRAVIDLMTTWRLPYATALRSVWTRTGTVPDLAQLELALHRSHYATMREVLSQGNGDRAMVLAQLQSDIDLVNLSTALRLARRPDLAQTVQRRYRSTDVRPLLLEPGGSLQTQRLAALVATAGGLEGMVRGLRDTPYGPALTAGWQRYQAGEGMAVLERELERCQAEHTAAMWRRDPLSIAIPMGYLGGKEVEGANLRLVAQAVALNIEPEQARRDLILI